MKQIKKGDPPKKRTLSTNVNAAKNLATRNAKTVAKPVVKATGNVVKSAVKTIKKTAPYGLANIVAPGIGPAIMYGARHLGGSKKKK